MERVLRHTDCALRYPRISHYGLMLNTLIERLTALLIAPFRPKLSNVLSLVNDARTSLNLPSLEALPSGDKARATRCPLALALGGMVGVDGICYDDSYSAQHVAEAWHTSIRRHNDRKFIVDLPQTLRAFVRDFDLGAYGARV